MSDLHFMIDYCLEQKLHFNLAAKYAAMRLKDGSLFKGVAKDPIHLRHFDMILNQFGKYERHIDKESKLQISESCLTILKSLEAENRSKSHSNLRFLLTQQGSVSVALMNMFPKEYPKSTKNFIIWYLKNLQMKKIPTRTNHITTILQHLTILNQKFTRQKSKPHPKTSNASEETSDDALYYVPAKIISKMDAHLSSLAIEQPELFLDPTTNLHGLSKILHCMHTLQQVNPDILAVFLSRVGGGEDLAPISNTQLVRLANLLLQYGKVDWDSPAVVRMFEELCGRCENLPFKEMVYLCNTNYSPPKDLFGSKTYEVMGKTNDA